MLIALSILLFGGGGSDNMWLFPPDFQKNVKVVVVENEKQTEILELYNEMVVNLKSSDKRISEIGEILYQTVRDYDATDSEINELIQKLLDERKETQLKLVDTRFKMAEKLTPQEWNDIFISTSAEKD